MAITSCSPPPLIIDEAELDTMVETLDRSIREVLPQVEKLVTESGQKSGGKVIALNRRRR